MNVKKILSTDVLAKLDAVAPGATELCPDIMDLANMFGSLRMDILCDLTPIELIYMIHSRHQMTYTLDGWEIKLNLVDIVYNLPEQMMTLYKQDVEPDNLLSDETLCMMLGNSLSQEAQRMFGENRYINEFISRENVDYFDGWKMEMLSIHDHEIVPNTPTTLIEHDLNDQFTHELSEMVMDMLEDRCDRIPVSALFSKRVKWDEFLMLARNPNIEIVNLTGSLREAIREGCIPDELYEFGQVATVTGGTRENVEYDYEKVNEALTLKGVIGVIVKTTTNFVRTGQFTIEAERKTGFDDYVEFIMADNILSVYADDLVRDADGNLVTPDQIETVDEPPTEDDVPEKELEQEITDAITEVMREMEEHPEEWVTLDDALDEEDDPIEGYKKSLGEMLSAMNEMADETKPELVVVNESGSLAKIENPVDPIDYGDDGVDNTTAKIKQKMDDIMAEQFAKVEPIIKQSLEHPTEEIPTATDPSQTKGIVAGLSFFYCGATFDTISQIEKNPKYQQEDTIGIICMRDNPTHSGSHQFTYYMGHPIVSENPDEPIRYEWKELIHDKLFSQEENKLFYFVYDWYGYDHALTNNVLWENINYPHQEGAKNEITG